jgi:hypothetical protein
MQIEQIAVRGSNTVQDVKIGESVQYTNVCWEDGRQ